MCIYLYYYGIHYNVYNNNNIVHYVEVKHYLHGLSQIHLTNKGVALRVKMAEDVLYNEVSRIIIPQPPPKHLHHDFMLH